MITVPPGCEIEYGPPNELEDEQRAIVEDEVKDVQSAGWNFLSELDTGRALALMADVPVALGQHVEYMWIHRGERFTMSQSGIEIMVHSPVPVEVDQESFAEVFHAPLTLDEEYEHPEIRQMMACYRRYILEDKKAAGELYHLLIPPPDYCIDNLQFKPTQDVDKCYSTGATPPKFKLEFIGFDVLDYPIMMVSSGQIEASADQDTSDTAGHEPIHAPSALMGQIFRFNPDEQFSHHVESVVRRYLYPAGFPTTIRYLQTD